MTDTAPAAAAAERRLDDQVLDKLLELLRADPRTADTVAQFGPMFRMAAVAAGVDVGPTRPEGAARQLLDVADAFSENLELAYESVRDAG